MDPDTHHWIRNRDAQPQGSFFDYSLMRIRDEKTLTGMRNVKNSYKHKNPGSIALLIKLSHLKSVTDLDPKWFQCRCRSRLLSHPRMTGS